MSYNLISNGPAPTLPIQLPQTINTGPVQSVVQPTDSYSDLFGLTGDLLNTVLQSRERNNQRKKVWAEEDKKINVIATQYKDLGIGSDQAYSLARSSIPLTSRTLEEAKAKRQFTDLYVKNNDNLTQNPHFAKITDDTRTLIDGYKKGSITDINGLDINELDVLSVDGLKTAWKHILPSEDDLNKLGPLKTPAINYVLKRGHELINLQGEKQNKQNQQILNNNAVIATSTAFSMALTGDLEEGTILNAYNSLVEADANAQTNGLSGVGDSVSTNIQFQLDEKTRNEHPSTIDWESVGSLIVKSDGTTLKQDLGVKKFNELQDSSRYIEKLADDINETVSEEIDALNITDPLEKQKLEQEMIMDSEEYQSLPSSSEKAQFLEMATKDRDEDAIDRLKLEHITGKTTVQEFVDSMMALHSAGYITDEQLHDEIYGPIKELQSRRDAANNAKIMADTLAKAIMADKKSALKDLVDAYTGTITSLGREGKPIRIRDAVPILQSFYGAAEIRGETMTPADYEAGRIMLNTGLRFVTTELNDLKNNYEQNLTDTWKTKRPRLSRNNNFNQKQFESFVEDYNERYNSDLNSLTEEQTLWQEELNKPFWKATPSN